VFSSIIVSLYAMKFGDGDIYSHMKNKHKNEHFQQLLTYS